ncbi:MAG: hypothetical protein ABR964_07500 [Tepidisphaeraceae bacterium]|jgi:uncharacterized membrane protein YfbV (UPF0208 family)
MMRKTAGNWDQIILPAAITALLAVAVTLAAIWRLGPIARPAPPDMRDAQIALLQKLLQERSQEISRLRQELTAATRPARSTSAPTEESPISGKVQ